MQIYWFPAVNFGQDSSFAGRKTAQGNQDGNNKGDFYYAPPSGFLALCSDNLADPSIALPGEHYNTVLYNGNNQVAQSITGVGFEPEFLWIKRRASPTGNYGMFDQVRGANKSIASNETYETQNRVGAVNSFDSDGFSLGVDTGTNVNYQTGGYVAWNWLVGGVPTADNSAGAGATPTAGSVKINGANLGSALAGSIAATRISANTTNGFSTVTYSGNGTSGATVGHGLAAAPTLIIIKSRDESGQDWITGATVLNANWEKYVKLNETTAVGDSTVIWNDTAPTASVFSLGNDDVLNKNASTYVAYCFSTIEGYSKVGLYEGNSNADGTFIYLGFKPAFILYKNIDSTDYDWNILDDKRDPYNNVTQNLAPNITQAEITASFGDFTSNGVKWRNTYGGSNSAFTYIYYAVAETPFKTANAR